MREDVIIRPSKLREVMSLRWFEGKIEPCNLVKPNGMLCDGKDKEKNFYCEI